MPSIWSSSRLKLPLTFPSQFPLPSSHLLSYKMAFLLFQEAATKSLEQAGSLAAHLHSTLTCSSVYYHLVYVHTRSCPSLCDPMDCSPSGFSVHGVFQARILEWVAISSSMGSSQRRDQTHGSYISRQILYPHHGQDLINCGLFLLMTVTTARRNPCLIVGILSTLLLLCPQGLVYGTWHNIST